MSRAMTAREFRLMLACAAAGLLTLTAWGASRLSDRRAAAAESARALSDCRRHARNIEALRRGPAAVGEREPASDELARRVERAAEAARFPANAVGRIEPEPARRVGDTPYREKPTQVRLRRVTLRQLFTFLHALSGGGGGGEDGPAGGGVGLRVRSVRLTAPRGLESGSAWDVDATLSYLVYDPKGSGGGDTNGGGARKAGEPVAAR